MRISSSAVFILISLWTLSTALADPASMTRDESVINTFQIMCQLYPPNFDDLDKRADLMRMKLLGDETKPGPQDTTMRSKQWAGMLNTGPFILLIDEMKGAHKTSTSCAIAGTVSNVDDFEAQVKKTLQLDVNPVVESNPAERGFIWDFPQDRKSIIIRDHKPSGQSTAMIKFVQTIEHD